MDGTEASAESSGPLKCPNSAQDTERAVNQTHKSKSHSKTKDTDGPWSTSPHVERTRYENSSAQSAGKASKRKSASLINIQRLKKPELNTVTMKLTSITVRREKRREKSFTLKGLGLDLIVQSQVIQCQAHLAVTRSRHVPLTITHRMAVTILIVNHQDIIVVVAAGLAPVQGQVPCQTLTQNQMG